MAWEINRIDEFDWTQTHSQLSWSRDQLIVDEFDFDQTKKNWSDGKPGLNYLVEKGGECKHKKQLATYPWFPFEHCINTWSESLNFEFRQSQHS